MQHDIWHDVWWNCLTLKHLNHPDTHRRVSSHGRGGDVIDESCRRDDWRDDCRDDWRDDWWSFFTLSSTGDHLLLDAPASTGCTSSVQAFHNKRVNRWSMILILKRIHVVHIIEGVMLQINMSLILLCSIKSPTSIIHLLFHYFHSIIVKPTRPFRSPLFHQCRPTGCPGPARPVGPGVDVENRCRIPSHEETNMKKEEDMFRSCDVIKLHSNVLYLF